jgi:hypothetical protein
MLSFIGTGSAFNTRLGNNGAYIRQGERLFLIDCGSATFARLMAARLLNGVRRVSVLVTHLHPDHVGSLGDLVFYAHHSLRAQVDLLFPAIEDLERLLAWMGVTKSLYRSFPPAGYRWQGITIARALPVEHAPPLKSFGYILEMPDQERIYYSGDAREVPGEILAMIREGSLQRAYQDTCKADYPGNPHLSLRKLAEIVAPGYRHVVCCMHLDETFDPEEAKSLGFQVAECRLFPEGF